MAQLSLCQIFQWIDQTMPLLCDAQDLVGELIFCSFELVPWCISRMFLLLVWGSQNKILRSFSQTREFSFLINFVITYYFSFILKYFCITLFICLQIQFCYNVSFFFYIKILIYYLICLPTNSRKQMPRQQSSNKRNTQKHDLKYLMYYWLFKWGVICIIIQPNLCQWKYSW